MSRIITDRAELSRQIQALHKAGKTIVFANGAFDVIHVGHVRYLQGAAAEGNVLDEHGKLVAHATTTCIILQLAN